MWTVKFLPEERSLFIIKLTAKTYSLDLLKTKTLTGVVFCICSGFYDKEQIERSCSF